MEDERIRVSKDTQKFITDISQLSHDKYEKVVGFLENLRNQQEAEAHLESKRGWRYMWQRTPKPYLLMLGYLVFLAPVGSFAYQAVSHIPDEQKIIYQIILALILLLPLVVVFYLSYNYLKQRKNEEKIEK
jgi:uncharacterized BrkB/YihY/UPF0761 family membrane protein